MECDRLDVGATYSHCHFSTEEEVRKMWADEEYQKTVSQIFEKQKAAEYINELNPEVVIPVHYGSIVGSANDASIFKDKVNPSINVTIKLEFH